MAADEPTSRKNKGLLSPALSSRVGKGEDMRSR